MENNQGELFPLRERRVGRNSKQDLWVMQQEVPGYIPPELVGVLFHPGLSSVQHRLASADPWLALWDSAQKASPTHITHSGGNPPLIYGSSWCLWRVWQPQLHSAVPRLAPAFLCPRWVAVIGWSVPSLLSIEPSSWASDSKWRRHRDICWRGATGVQAFLVGTQTCHHHNGLLEEVSGCLLSSSSTDTIWSIQRLVLWFRAWQLWLQGHQPALSLSPAAELGWKSWVVAALCSFSQFLCHLAGFPLFFPFCSVAHGMIVIKSSIHCNNMNTRNV